MRLVLIILFAFLGFSVNANESESSKKCIYHIRAASMYRSNHQYQESIEELKKFNTCGAKSNQESETTYYYHLGWTYHEMRNYNKAITAYTKALESQPDYAYAYWRRGLSYESLGEPSKAESDFHLAYEVGMKNNPKQFMEYLESNPDVKEKLVKQK